MPAVEQCGVQQLQSAASRCPKAARTPLQLVKIRAPAMPTDLDRRKQVDCIGLQWARLCSRHECSEADRRDRSTQGFDRVLPTWKVVRSGTVMKPCSPHSDATCERDSTLCHLLSTCMGRQGRACPDYRSAGPWLLVLGLGQLSCKPPTLYHNSLGPCDR